MMRMATESGGQTTINDHRRRLFARTGGPIAFVCECSPGCTSTVPLTADEFDERRATPPGTVVHAEHAAA